MVRQAHHDHPEPVEGSPPPLPCGVTEHTPQGEPSPIEGGGVIQKKWKGNRKHEKDDSLVLHHPHFSFRHDHS